MIPHRTGRPFLVLLAVVSFLFAVGGCDLAPDLNCTPGTGPRLVLRGDSLGAFAESIAEPGIEAGHPDGPVCYKAKAGSQINEHQPSLPLVGPEDCVLMELGTNDLLNQLWADAKVDLYRAADELADARVQIWFTLNQTGADLHGFPYDRRVEWFNAELLAMAGSERWPNLVVWRWDLTAEGHPEWLNLPDDLHYNDEGWGHFADTLVQAAAMCPEPNSTPPPGTTTTDSPAVRATILLAA